MASENRKHKAVEVTEREFELLDLLYRFRFSTLKLFQRSITDVHYTTIHRRLEALIKRGLVERYYSSDYKIIRKPGRYFLTPRGMDTVMVIDKTAPQQAKMQSYRNKRVSEEFIERCIRIFEIALNLEAELDRDGGYFSSIQLRIFDYFPHPRPDGFIASSDKLDAAFYMVEYCESAKPTFVHIKKLKKYIEYESSEEWNVTNTKFPTLLFICETERVKANIIRKGEYLMDEIDIELRVQQCNQAALRI